jgi:hypothetical protein
MIQPRFCEKCKHVPLGDGYPFNYCDACRDEYLIAGRKLDELVAEKVMGWVRRAYTINASASNNPRPEEVTAGLSPPNGEKTIPQYSTGTREFQTVLDKLDAQMNANGTTWIFSRPGLNDIIIPVAESMPHAICLAALKAVGELK